MSFNKEGGSMGRVTRNVAGAILLGIGSLSLPGCRSEADVASKNVSTAADNFEVPRRVVLYNGITDRVIMTMEGYCSLGNNETDAKRTVTCKVGRNEYQKHIFQLSDNVILFAEQLEPSKVSGYYYRRVLRPQELIPDVSLQVDIRELPGDKR